LTHPPAFEETFTVYLAAVRNCGDSARARRLANISKPKLEEWKTQFPLFDELVKEAHQEFFDEALIAARNRFIEGTLEGYVTHPTTGEVTEKRNYHDALFNSLVRLHPQANLSDDNNVTVVIRDIASEKTDSEKANDATLPAP